MLARRTTRLAVFGLIAATGVMAAAGPRDNRDEVRIAGHGDGWSISGIFGGGHDDHDRRVIVRPAPAARTFEVAPRNLQFQAFQTGDTVVLFVRGENTAPGFTTTLTEMYDRRSDGVGRVALCNFIQVYDGNGLNFNKRGGSEACIPFAVSGSFQTREKLREIRIDVAGHEECVQVQCVEQMQHGR